MSISNSRFLLLILILLAPIFLQAQANGFSRIYPEISKDYVPVSIVTTQSGYEIICDNNGEVWVFTTDANGEQLNFEPYISGCAPELPVDDYLHHDAVNFNDNYVLLDNGGEGFKVQRVQRSSCSAATELIWEQDFALENENMQARSIAVDRGPDPGVFVIGYEYKGLTADPDPGLHIYNLWILKMDYQGNELWRQTTSFDLHSSDQTFELAVQQTTMTGGAMMIYQNIAGSYPYFATFDGAGQEIYGGKLSNSMDGFFIGSPHIGLHGGAYFLTYSGGGGHLTTSINRNPAPESTIGNFSFNFSLDTPGKFKPSENGGIVASKNYVWSNEFDLVRTDIDGSITSAKPVNHGGGVRVIGEAQDGEPLLAGWFEGVLWFMKSCYPDIAPAVEQFDLVIDSAYVPEPIGGMGLAAGQAMGVLYRFGYTPGTEYLPDNEVNVGFYLSEDDQYDEEDKFLTEWNWNGLNPLGFFPFQGFSLPFDLTIGDYYILCYIDDIHQYAEPNEVNNIYPIGFKVIAELGVQGGESVLISEEVELCYGDTFAGVTLFSDSTFLNESYFFIDSMGNVLYDSVLQTVVHVADQIEYHEDISLEVGSEYNGILINSDTTLLTTLTAANGCDSLVYTHIQTVTGLNSVLEIDNLITVYPNPVKDAFYLNLKPGTGELKSIQLVNAKGIEVNMSSTSNRLFTSTKQLNIDMKDHVAGVYYLGVEIDQQVYWKRIVKIN